MERYNQLAQQLGQEFLAEGGMLRLQVNGVSMAPTLLPGDVIWVEPVAAAELAPGDLVLARRAGDMVTHRLISSGESGWVLKGDACGFPDPPLPAESLVGRAVQLERKGQRVRLDSAEVRTAGQRIAWMGRMETGIYRWCLRMAERVFGADTPGWVKQVGRLASRPFRWVIRIM